MAEMGPVTRAEVAEEKVENLMEGVVLMQDVLTQTERERDAYRAELERIANTFKGSSMAARIGRLLDGYQG